MPFKYFEITMDRKQISDFCDSLVTNIIAFTFCVTPGTRREYSHGICSISIKTTIKNTLRNKQVVSHNLFSKCTQLWHNFRYQSRFANTFAQQRTVQEYTISFLCSFTAERELNVCPVQIMAVLPDYAPCSDQSPKVLV